MKNIDAIKDSALWQDAVEQYALLSLNDKVLRLSREIYPERKDHLDLEEKLDVIMKCPNMFELIGEYLDQRQYKLLKLMDDGRSMAEASEEMGFSSRSSATQIMHTIRGRLEELLTDEDDLEDKIIKLCG